MLDKRVISIALNELGLSTKELVDYYDMTYAKINYFVKSNDIKQSKYKNLFKNGVTYNLEDLSNGLEVDLELVEYAYKLFNNRYSIITFEEAYQAIAVEHMSVSELANQLGCSRQNLHSIIQKYGIDMALPLTKSGNRSVVKAKFDLIKDDLIRDYLDGESTIKLAEKYNTTHKSVYAILSENDVYEDRKNIDIDLDEVIYYYLEGYTIEDIAKLMDVKSSTLHNKLKEAGVKEYSYYKNRERLDIDVDVVKHMYINKNLGIGKIALELGVCYASVYNVIKKEGIAINISKFNYTDYVIYKDLGYTDEAIIYEMGIDSKTYYNAIKKHRDKIGILNAVLAIKDADNNRSILSIAYDLDINYSIINYMYNNYKLRLDTICE